VTGISIASRAISSARVSCARCWRRWKLAARPPRDDLAVEHRADRQRGERLRHSVRAGGPAAAAERRRPRAG
jgi:hypothetical protein